MLLQLKHPYIESSAVTRLQELCDLAGCDTGDNDGIFGPKTEVAVVCVQQKLGLEVDGIAGPITWEALNKLADLTGEGTSCRIKDKNFVDISGTHQKPRLYAYQRNLGDIHGITLHQTACTMPNTPEGWHKLNAHCGITRNGVAVIVNDFTDMIWHGQGLSKTTIGIEIEGNYQGIDGNSRTLWKGGPAAASLTEDMEDAFWDLMMYIRMEWGINFKYVHAHRQSKDTRMGDPGSEIWQKLAIPLKQKYNLSDGGPEWCRGTGKPIPRAWDENYTASYV